MGLCIGVAKVTCGAGENVVVLAAGAQYAESRDAAAVDDGGAAAAASAHVAQRARRGGENGVAGRVSAQLQQHLLSCINIKLKTCIDRAPRLRRRLPGRSACRRRGRRQL